MNPISSKFGLCLAVLVFLSISQASAQAIPSSSTWEAPIGIPYPEFGIGETVENIHGDANHCTHTYPCSLVDLRPGNVVCIPPGTYSFSTITGDGELNNPIFVRGTDPNNKPIITSSVSVSGSYIIIENLEIDGGSLSIEGGPQHHISFRHSEVHDTGSAIYTSYYNAPSRTDYIEDLVFYDINCHDLGDWEAPVQADLNCIAVGSNTKNIWIVDNELHHNQGDGVATPWGFQPETFPNQVASRNVYIGRNNIHHNHENAIDIKCTKNYTISQNTMHDIKGTLSAAGDAIVLHNDNDGCLAAGAQDVYFDNIWIIYNEFYNTEFGVNGANGGDRGSNPSNIYVIGNIFRDIVNITGPVKTNSWGAGVGIRASRRTKVTSLNNVFYNVSRAIAVTNDNRGTDIINNIISNVQALDEISILIEHNPMAELSSAYNNLFWQNGNPIEIRWGTNFYSSLASFETAEPDAYDNINSDPLFINSGNNNFSITQGSRAIDNGVTSSIYQLYSDLYGLDISVDYNDLERPQNGLWDIGAFEYSGGAGECSVTEDCDDTNDCTTDVCDSGSCRYKNYNLDGNNNIGLGDIIQIIAYWGGSNLDVDLDENGNVGLSDIIILIGVWGEFC